MKMFADVAAFYVANLTVAWIFTACIIAPLIFQWTESGTGTVNFLSIVVQFLYLGLLQVCRRNWSRDFP
jgi:hypothetical protein